MGAERELENQSDNFFGAIGDVFFDLNKIVRGPGVDVREDCWGVRERHHDIHPRRLVRALGAEDGLLRRGGRVLGGGNLV